MGSSRTIRNTKSRGIPIDLNKLAKYIPNSSKLLKYRIICCIHLQSRIMFYEIGCKNLDVAMAASFPLSKAPFNEAVFI